MRTKFGQAVAEVVGTFALVFIGAGSVVVWSLGLGVLDGTGLLAVALAHGLVLAIMVTSFGHISGGHFNPAVTIGVWVVGKIETVRAGMYIVAQLIGATLGALTLRWALPQRIWKPTSLGLPAVSHELGITSAKAVLIEAVLTFFLVVVVFATAVDDRGAFKSIAGFAIGLVLTMDTLFGGRFTGASMNPARTFGPALVAGKWTDFWVYLVGPAIGAVVAASLYWFLYLREREVAAPVTETPIGGGPEGVMAEGG
jgi:MIP family channel proteins